MEWGGLADGQGFLLGGSESALELASDDDTLLGIY